MLRPSTPRLGNQVTEINNLSPMRRAESALSSIILATGESGRSSMVQVAKALEGCEPV